MDKCCQSFLAPTVLKLQRDEINQSVYYVANLVDQEDIMIIGNEFHEDECTESPHATINQLLEASGHSNVKKIWAVKVRNSQTAKHPIVLLKNNVHISRLFKME